MKVIYEQPFIWLLITLWIFFRLKSKFNNLKIIKNFAINPSKRPILQKHKISLIINISNRSNRTARISELSHVLHITYKNHQIILMMKSRNFLNFSLCKHNNSNRGNHMLSWMQAAHYNLFTFTAIIIIIKFDFLKSQLSFFVRLFLLVWVLW